VVNVARHPQSRRDCEAAIRHTRAAVAGYSGTPLIKKLGIASGQAASVLGAPAHYASLLGPLPEGVKLSPRLRSACDFIHVFVTQERDLQARFPKLKQALNKTGALWISWPKGSSKIEKDLNENTIRRIGLAHGLVDVKVCAVDDDWSGLKFMVRRKDR
jgi:hypothetical protein